MLLISSVISVYACIRVVTASLFGTLSRQDLEITGVLGFERVKLALTVNLS